MGELSAGIISHLTAHHIGIEDVVCSTSSICNDLFDFCGGILRNSKSF